MKKRSCLAACGVAAVVGFASASAIEFVDFKPSWPQSAQIESISQMARLMVSHDCTTQMDVWKRSANAESQYLYREENDFCKEHYEHAGWKIEDNAVTGLFRCGLGDRFAEYALTIKNNSKHADRWHSCQYVVKPRSEDRGVGKNF